MEEDLPLSGSDGNRGLEEDDIDMEQREVDENVEFQSTQHALTATQAPTAPSRISLSDYRATNAERAAAKDSAEAAFLAQLQATQDNYDRFLELYLSSADKDDKQVLKDRDQLSQQGVDQKIYHLLQVS
ncbi:hypothetical protein BGX28_002087 [Mortierella sp. GBA30]|nr:hypothetical protein BGX28_002087 [Mortierella sp. GBA30]